MGHETLVYGFISGALSREKHDFHGRNRRILGALPGNDEFPFLTRGMFSCIRMDQSRQVFRTPIIHFGGSMNGLHFDEVPMWIAKFEALLAKLYWTEATAHIWTDFIDGCYQYWWKWKPERIAASYETGDPLTTSEWLRDV